MSMPPHPGDPALPSLMVLGTGAAPRQDPDLDAGAPRPARTRRLPEWLKRPIPLAGGMSFTRSLVSELGLETGCESARWSQSLGMLDQAHRHVHDPGRRLHPAVWLLRRRSRTSRPGRQRRARSPRRSMPSPGTAARGYHLGHPRRPAGRWRRALSPVRPGRSHANRGHDRSPHARLRRPSRSDRRRPSSSARDIQPQHGNGREASTTQCTPARASTA